MNILEIIERMMVEACLNDNIRKNSLTLQKAEVSRDISQIIVERINHPNIPPDELMERIEGVISGLSAGLALLVFILGMNADGKDQELNSLYEKIRENASHLTNMYVSIRDRADGKEKESEARLDKLKDALKLAGVDVSSW